MNGFWQSDFARLVWLALFLFIVALFLRFTNTQWRDLMREARGLVCAAMKELTGRAGATGSASVVLCIFLGFLFYAVFSPSILEKVRKLLPGGPEPGDPTNTTLVFGLVALVFILDIVLVKSSEDFRRRSGRR